MNLLLITLFTSFMNYQMPQLPYATNALEPVISKETIEYHYGKHLQTYIDNLNRLVKDTEFEGKPIEEIVRHAPDGALFNNAGQVLNHVLYFTQFTPTPKRNKPEGDLAEAIRREYGSFENFQTEFNTASIGLFGSGWVWLAMDADGNLHIVKEANGGNPQRKLMKPLLGFDVWEHAYYLDYQNRRGDHLKELWKIIDWEEIERRMKQ